MTHPSDTRLEHLTRVLQAIRKIHQVIAKAKNRETLLPQACSILTETCGYFHAWIALFDETERFLAFYESGLGPKAQILVDRLRIGKFPDCVRHALEREGVWVTQYPPGDCVDCPHAALYARRAAIGTRLSFEGRLLGVMTLSIPHEYAEDLEERDLVAEIADHLAYALSSLEKAKRRTEIEKELLLHRQITAALPYPVSIIGRDYRYLAVNEVYAKLFGVPCESIIGHTIAEFLGDKVFEEKIRSHLDRVLAGSTETDEVEIFFPGVGRRWMLIHYSPYRDERGEIIGVVSHGINITDRKRAETSLRESEEKFRNLFRDHAAVKLLIDPETGAIVDASEEALRFYGYTRDEMLRMKITDINKLPPEKVKEEMEKAKELKRVHSEFRHKLANGAIRDVEVFSSRVDIKGKPYLYSIIHDITDKKKAEQSLRESEQAYRNLFEHMLDGFALHEMIYDAEGHPVDYRFLTVNPAFERLTGLKASEILGKTVLEVLPQTEPVWIQRYGKVASTGTPIQFEEYSGALQKHFEVSAFCPERGKFACIFRDITDRVRAEELLTDALSRLRQVVRAGNIGLWDWDLRTNFVRYSSEWKKQLGYTDEEIGNTYEEWESRLHPEDRQKIVETVQGWIRDKIQNNEIVFRLRHKDGTYRWILANSSLILDEAGNIIRVLGSHTDITEQKKQEQLLQESESQFRGLFEKMPVGCAIYEAVDNGMDFVFVDLNPAGERFSKVVKNEIVGKRVTEVFPGVVEMSLLECFREVYRTGEARHHPLTLYKDSHLEEWVENWVFRLPSGRIVAIYEDRTEERRIEEALRQGEKMRAIGQLTSGIAHDFKNLVTAILGYAFLLQQRLTDPKAKEEVGYIISSAQIAEDLIQKLLRTTRKNEKEVRFDLHSVLQQVITILQHTLGKKIRMIQELRAHPSTLLGDPTDLQVAILNLAINARDAMPKGGTLTFSTSNVTLTAEACTTLSPPIQPGDYLLLEITDSGCGMDEKTKSRLFEPFFTTKEEGRGTGLGLAMVYNTVQNHHGAIQVESEVGRGTTVRIYLPCEMDTSEGR